MQNCTFGNCVPRCWTQFVFFTHRAIIIAIFGLASNSYYLLIRIQGKESFDTTAGEQIYSYLYAKDFAKAICHVIGAKDKSGIYNISQPLEEHSNKDILETIKAMMGSNIQYNYGAVAYPKDQVMLMSGIVDKFEKAFERVPHTDFQIALRNTINSL